MEETSGDERPQIGVGLATAPPSNYVIRRQTPTPSVAIDVDHKSPSQPSSLPASSRSSDDYDGQQVVRARSASAAAAAVNAPAYPGMPFFFVSFAGHNTNSLLYEIGYKFARVIGRGAMGQTFLYERRRKEDQLEHPDQYLVVKRFFTKVFLHIAPSSLSL
jgi:Tfp pilus assembly protein PilW